MKKIKTDYGNSINFHLIKLMKVMKITCLFLMIALVQVSASNTYSQSAKMSFNLKNAMLSEVFDQIQENSEFRFFYDSENIDLSRKVTINADDSKIDEILNNVFSDSDLSYEIFDRYIIVKTKGSEIDFSNTIISQQPQSISGTIKDESGLPLPGVTVLVKGTTQGTVTNADGEFSIPNVPEDAVLQFSFVGLKAQEIPVAGKSVINVVMEEESIGIDEIVAIGYGTQKKGTMTSSVAVVKSDDIQKYAVADVSNALSGKASGLIVRNFNAEPGNDASDIYVRGVSTTGSNNALIVVDGIPDRDLSLIDINDIESVTVLKDASAVAPYGSRGANGVILVTTKRGKEGKPTINYKAYYGISQPTRLPEFCSSADYARMFNEASRNEGKEEPFTADDISKFESGTNPDYPNTNWWNEIMQKDPVQTQHSLSISGAKENISYYLSMGAYRQDGYFDKANFRKYNMRANIDANVTNDIKVSLDVMGYTDEDNNPSTSISSFLEFPMRIPNTWPVKIGEGQYVKPTVSNNPVAELEYGGGTVDKSNSFNGSLTFEYKPSFVQGLTLKGLGVYDFGVSHSKTWLTPYATWRMVDRANSLYEEIPPTTKPSLSERSDFSSTKQLEFHADYKTTIAEKHNVGALFVFNRTEWNSNYLSGRRINYASTAIDQLFAGPSDGQSTNGSASEGARLGYIGRLTYDYNAKYMAEVNFRYDGSMKFAPGKRWGLFPSFSLGWRLSEENFIKDNLQFIDNLKLRASWGKAGNDRVGDYQYLATYGMQSTPYSLGGAAVQAAKESRLPNPDITWEVATLTDIGLEGTFWKNLLTVEADYFFKRTEDILRPTQKTSSIIGIALPDANIGIVENKGIEFTLGHHNRINDFNYHVNFVYTYATNKAVELGEAEGTLNDPFRKRTGNPLNSAYGKIALGLFTSPEEIANSPYQGSGIVPGDIKYKDFNGPNGVPDGVIDAYDETKIGFSTVPEIIYGINIGAEYKGFDLAMNFQGATNVNYTFTDYAGYAFYNGGNIQTWQMEERWTEENNNANARYPRLTTAPGSNNITTSSYWLRDGTYLRLKTLQIGYNFNQSLLSKVNVKGLRVYLSGQNVFTWVKDDLFKFDPEAYHQWGQFYPQAKVYTIGIDLTF